MSFTKKKKMVIIEMLRIFEVMSDRFNGGGVCAKENSCESVLDNLTTKMFLQFVETSAAICRTSQHNIREDLGLQKYLFNYYYYHYYYCTHIY